MATPDILSQRSPLPRQRSGLAGLSGGAGTPNSPHTPVLGRSISSQYGSPSNYRPEEELVIYGFDARAVQAGLPGEVSPRCYIQYSPERSRRIGDFRGALLNYGETLADSSTAEDWQLWNLDVRGQDLGLVEDKLERLLREVHHTHLLMEAKPRKTVLVVPACLPYPLLDVILRLMFQGPHQSSSIQAYTRPVLHAVAAGVRSALTIDIGWHETTVTAVYEYREVLQRQTDRGTRAACEEMRIVLSEGQRSKVSFATAEDVTTRLAWCKSASIPGSVDDAAEDDSNTVLQINENLTQTITIPFLALSRPAETTFFDAQTTDNHVDDNHLPVHLLAWKCLLALPLDVRATCMSRIIITGESILIPGLKSRLLSEIDALVKHKGWDPVMTYGSAAEARKASMHVPNTIIEANREQKNDEVVSAASRQDQEIDEIAEKLDREATRITQPPLKAVVRGIETLGAWAGASIISNLRVDAAVEIKRDEYLKHGLGSIGHAI